MPKPRKHIFVCRNYREPDAGKPCCEARGAEQVFETFKRLRAEADLLDSVKLTKVKCFGKCEFGPNVVIYPDNVWYSGITPDNAREIMESHIINNKPVERLFLPDEKI